MDDLARRANCTDVIAGNGLDRPAELLATIGDDVEPDRYGEGGVVAEFEREVAELLGKPAALFLPSGTMAQAATLRVHADTRGSRTVVWHPLAHPARHEGEAYSRLHGLVGRSVGEATRLLTLDDLRTVAERYAALLVELPQRDLGGQLPPFEELAAQVAFARERGAATHLDGARLWEASAGYGRPPAEIAALFDTVYVSFYKGVGALPGCCVAGTETDVAQSRSGASVSAARCSASGPAPRRPGGCCRQRSPRCRRGWNTPWPSPRPSARCPAFGSYRLHRTPR